MIFVLGGKVTSLMPSRSNSRLETVNSLGSLYTDQGKLAEAEQIYERVLLGPEQPYPIERALNGI